MMGLGNIIVAEGFTGFTRCILRHCLLHLNKPHPLRMPPPTDIPRCEVAWGGFSNAILSELASRLPAGLLTPGCLFEEL